MPPDRVVLVAGGEGGTGRDLALGLADGGCVVVTTTSAFDSCDDALATFAPHAPFDALVHVPAGLDAVPRAPLVATGEREWDARGEALLRAALWSCQAAHAHLRDGAGRIVLVTPTVGLVGAADLVPLATAIEGMRALAKVAARQWGSAGITVNCVACALEPVVAGPLPPALGRVADMRRDVAPIVALLLGDGAAALTGATLPVDGGVVMTT